MRALSLSALLIPALFLAGCDEIDFGGSSDRYKEDFHFSQPLPSGGRLSVENSNGSIEISTWDKDTVDISGTKYANTPELLSQLKIDVVPSSGAVSVRTIRPSNNWRGGAGARYMIRVPKRVELERIVSSNGAIRIDGVEGNALLKTSNGGIRSIGTRGNLDASTSNGSVELQHTGNVDVHSSNGGIRADVERGTFIAGTSNGSINARLGESNSNQPVRLESSNGGIDVTMNSAREIRASTSNSGITVRMPGGANATLRAHTSNSNITTDFDVMVRGTQSKSRLEGNIGNGGPLLELSSTNGNIKVLRH